MRVKPKHFTLLLLIISIITLLFILSKKINKNNDLVMVDIDLKSNNEKKLQNEMDNFIKPVLVPPTIPECKNYLQVFEVNEIWKNENKTRLKELLVSFLERGLTGEELDHVAFLTEIGPSNAKALIGLYNTTNSSLPIISGVEGAILPKEYSARVYEYLLDHKMDDIIHLVEKGIISGNTFIISAKGQYSLIGTLLMNAIINKKNYDVVNQLIGLNIEITYQDLMVATQLNMPLDFLQKLWSASKLNSSFVLSFRGVDKSLAQIALENNNPELLDFWLSQGSASVIEPFKSTLLDMLPPAINDAEKPMKTELLQILMRYNVTANKLKTKYKLGSWLDEHFYSQYISHIEKKNFMSIDISNRLQVGNAITDIFFAVLQPLIKSQNKLNVQHQCFQPEALRIIDSIFQQPITRLPPKIRLNIKTQEATEQHDYSQEQLLEMNVHNAIAILGKDKTLTAKYSIVNFGLKRIKQHLKFLSNKEYTEQELEEQHKFVNLIELAENGQWQNVLTELTKNEYPSKTIDFIMLDAMEQKKDINLILQLYSFNSNFSTAFMHAVVKRNDVNLARILVSHGLDFTQSNERGANAIYTAVSHRKMAMLRYLINEGIKVKPYEFGLDPLDIALKNLKSDVASFNFVTILIDAGAPIESSHKEKTLEFSHTHLELYLKLITRFPMLKSSLNT